MVSTEQGEHRHLWEADPWEISFIFFIQRPTGKFRPTPPTYVAACKSNRKGLSEDTVLTWCIEKTKPEECLISNHLSPDQQRQSQSLNSAEGQAEYCWP